MPDRLEKQAKGKADWETIGNDTHIMTHGLLVH